MASVFISYRRDDTAAHAGRLSDALIAEFGRRNVFMDIDAISPGVDFEQRIHDALTTCDVVLVLIGNNWLGESTAGDLRRIDSDEDFVRKEVAAALERTDLVVVPVLVEGVEMPAPEILPTNIAPLARRHAFELSDTRWRYDVSRLVEIIEDSAARGPGARLLRRIRRHAWRAAALLAIVGVGIAAVLLTAGGGTDPDKKVADCQRRHGLTRPEAQRDARPGESQIEPVGPSGIRFAQRIFASCDWPPGPGADPDGYTAIVVTASDGPGPHEASGRNSADRFETNCDRLRVEYSYSKMGGFERLPVFTAKVGEIWAPEAEGFVRTASSGLLNLPFAPLRNEVTVLRNSSYRLDRVGCAG